jgi:hypothetical protein
MIKQLSENGPVGVLKPCCTIVVGRIRALARHTRSRLLHLAAKSAWHPNHGRRCTYRHGKSVQTTGTTSDNRDHLILNFPLYAECYDSAPRRWTVEGKRRIVAESYDWRRQVSATAWVDDGSPFTWQCKSLRRPLLCGVVLYFSVSATD